jgi:hypothetical protein
MQRAVLVVLAVAASLALAGAVAARRAVRPAAPGDTLTITAGQRAAGLRFAPSVSAADRGWVLDVIARAQPAARRLIAEVDGLVTIDTAGSVPAMGLTSYQDGAFRIWLNVRQLDGARTIDRPTTLLHEFGHVVDIALIPAALDRTLDAGIPRGGVCDRVEGFEYGSCAAPEERLADTFAKWALGGAVSAVGAGYGVPAPASLADWGAPLAALG